MDSLLRLDAEETGVLLQIQAGVLDVELGFLHLALVFAPVEDGNADRCHDQPYPVIETLRVGERVAIGILRHPVQLDISKVGIADRQPHGGQHIGARHLHLLLGCFHLFPQKRKFRTLGNMPGNEDRFITVCVDIDLAYKITNSLDYEASRFTLMKHLEEVVGKKFAYWRAEGETEESAFIIRTTDKEAVLELKQLLEHVKKEEKSPVVASISKPYKKIEGIKKSYIEAKKLFGMASISGASAFTASEEVEVVPGEEPAADMDNLIVNAVRRNNKKELKEAFIQLIYGLPHEEERQCKFLHRVMLKSEFMLQDSYGLTEEIKEKFRNYYYNLENLNAAKTVDVCYKILCDAIDAREKEAEKDETRYFKEYMSEAVAYIEDHLQDEDLSIVSVAAHIYLNPVYFGRVFKHTFHMTFKKYLMQQRMEKAKALLSAKKSRNFFARSTDYYKKRNVLEFSCRVRHKRDK